ncbi:MAG: DNA polymerase III subunit delta [Bacteroidetes bacterium]|nr:DNA polymerase III subunit delta [Bacteroidota bacterium]
MRFKDVAGQQKVKNRLIQSVKTGRVSHAQLFYGPEGCGNLALVLAYIQFIYCENPGPDDSCGVCFACIKSAKLIHPDIHFVFPVATSKEVPDDPTCSKYLNRWREIVKKNPYINLISWLAYIGVENKQGIITVHESSEIVKTLLLKPYEAEYKSVIIWMPEKLHPSAATKLLKIIEEPPEKTFFLLVTHNYESILKTILSRTSLVKIPRIDDNSLMDYAVEKGTMDRVEALKCVRYADGNMLRLGTMMESDASENQFLLSFRKLLQNAYQYDILAMYAWLDEISLMGREKQKNFLFYGSTILREALVFVACNGKINRTGPDETEFITKLSSAILKGNNTWILRAMAEEMEKAHNHIDRNVNARTVFFDLSVRLCDTIRGEKRT